MGGAGFGSPWLAQPTDSKPHDNCLAGFFFLQSRELHIQYAIGVETESQVSRRLRAEDAK